VLVLPLALALALPSPTAGSALATPASPAWRGVALGLYSEDPGFSYAPLLGEIKALGATHVELVINLYQHDGSSEELYAHTRFTATDEAVRTAMRDARALGLKVVLLPIVRLEAGRPGEWRGNLAPKNASAWWRSYGQTMVRYARLARSEKAAGLVIGSELSTLDGDPAPWQALAQKVRRELPSASVIYAANWDHYRDVKMWDAVDTMALSAYFELAGPSPEATWRALRKELETFAGSHPGKRLLFTEVGYLSQRGGAAWPWKEGAEEPVDMEEQRRCYEAFTRAWDGESSLAGVFFWNWYGWGGAGSRGYTPRQKPAAEEIKRWFLQGRASSTERAESAGGKR
jgi:hypothetical protein